MGDGGGCHPRDNIALSFIANEAGLSHNIFDDLMKAREGHADWLAQVAIEFSGGLPILMLGRSFKPETNIETGSPAILVASIIKEKGHTVDHVEDQEDLSEYPCVFIGTAHRRYKQYEFPKGTTVIDPFGIIPDQREVKVIRLGRY
jgi:UDPglucose 6-dehydrogenase